MAKDDRKINSAIREGGVVYKEGMEDELSGAIPQETLDQLVSSGALAGTWKSTKKAAKVEDKK